MMKEQSRLVITAIILTVLFLVVEFIVLTGLTQKIDADSFALINNWGPSAPIDALMILLSLYGREVVWASIIIILIKKGGKEQKKTAILMIILFVASITKDPTLVSAFPGFVKFTVLFSRERYGLIAGSLTLIFILIFPGRCNI